jgi:hypothetical protein
MSNILETEVEVPAHLTNDKRYGDLMRQVTSLGGEAALGRDSLPKLAHAVAKAAADGVIDLETKNAKGEDIATQIYARYAAAESKKAIHEHSKGGLKGNASKLRQIIAMGAMTTIDAVEVMDDAKRAREAMEGTEGVKVKSAYPFYVDVARAQQASPAAALSFDELKELACKEGSEPKTVEQELRRVLKTLEGLVSGENNHGIRDDDALTIAAVEAVKARLDAMALLAARNKLLAEAAALGLKLA